jgi:predicted esterase
VKRLWALSLLCSCVLVNASRNATAFDSLVTIRGDINQGFPTFLVLFRELNGGWERVSSRVLYAPAHFEILAEPGTLKLYAFTHASAAWKEGCGSALVALHELPQKQVIELGAVELKENGPPPPEPIDFDAPDAPKDLVVMHRGDLATLDDERFRPAAGKLGLWQPVDFALKYGIGVSFLEPYDAKKTPVLFVHGASGTPQHFREMIAALDRTRFQPWVFSYPSGARLDRTATNLTAIVEDLRAHYGFSRLLVVGYSMGGLVAHAFTAKSEVVKAAHHPLVALRRRPGCTRRAAGLSGGGAVLVGHGRGQPISAIAARAAARAACDVLQLQRPRRRWHSLVELDAAPRDPGRSGACARVRRDARLDRQEPRCHRRRERRAR